MMSGGQKATRDSRKRWRDKNKTVVKERGKTALEWYHKNKVEINKKKRENRQIGTCDIIKKHHEDMKDDSERLTTEFIKGIVNIKCDD